MRRRSRRALRAADGSTRADERPTKKWKLTEEDWRNRERGEHYELAVHDMVERSSTRAALWQLVNGNDKRHARVSIIESMCERLESALGSSSKKKRSE